MSRAFSLLFAIAVSVGAAPVGGAELTAYRQFQLGADLETVAKQAGVPLSEFKTVHSRPAVIQEMSWQPHYQNSSRGSQDPVDQVLFSFSNRKLFQIVVVYNRTSTEGLLPEDIIERVTIDYGPATRPIDAEMIFPAMFNESAKVLARWEDPQATISLIRSAYRSTFGLILVSRQLEPAARQAALDALRLDESEAPGREAEAERKKAEETRVKDDQSRRINKPSFRP